MLNPNVEEQLLCDGDTPLRPSDWTQRLAGLDASFGPDRRLRYSRYLWPVNRDGRRCLCLHPAMGQDRPVLLRALLTFAEENGLEFLPASV